METCEFKTDVMLDIETLSTAPNAAILSIGAVAFELWGDGPLSGTGVYSFLTNIELQSCLFYGQKADGGSFKWWMAQEDKARAALFDPEPLAMHQALAQFRDWYEEFGPARLWSHGANFDVPILDSAYRAMGFDSPPWQYNAVRDTRTLFHVAGAPWDDWFEEMRVGTEHNALDDALTQVLMVQRAWRMVRQS